MWLIDVKWQGSSLKQDSSNRLVTDSEKTTWNRKANNNHTHNYIPLSGTTELVGSIIPKSSKAYDLGSRSYRMAAIYTDIIGICNSNNAATNTVNIAMYGNPTYNDKCAITCIAYSYDSKTLSKGGWIRN